MSVGESPKEAANITAAHAGNGTSEGEATTFVGVDVGGTKVSIATMSPGHFGEPRLLATEKSSQQALLDQLGDAITAAIASSEVPVAGVGLGIPSVIEFASGRVRSSVNVPLANVPVREVIRERLGGTPVFVDNDATCAALAEAYSEHGVLVTANLVMFTVGTGVGGGIVIDGRPYRGATGAAAELGHTIVGLDLADGATAAPAGGQAGSQFPREGSLESLASGRALDALARKAAATHPDSALGRLAATGAAVGGPEAVAAAQEGDVHAVAALRLLGERLGVGIAGAINTLDPDVVAIGGGASAAGQLLLEPARQTALRFVLPGVGTKTEIRLARWGPAAGVRGAALLAYLELQRARERGVRP